MTDDWKTDWWKTFFSDAWLDIQRETWTEEETEREAEFIQQVLGLSAPAEILDVPCGEGRHALAMASRGYRVTGVDITPALLEDARRESEKRGLRLELELADMRELPWENRFDGALSFWGSLGYFDEQGNTAFLYSVAKALKPGGQLVLDTHVAETLLPRFEERAWRYAGKTLVLEDRFYDHRTSRIDVEWTFVKDGQTHSARSSMRIYTYQELINLLEEVGLECIEAFGSPDQEAFTLGSERLLLLAGR